MVRRQEVRSGAEMIGQWRGVWIRVQEDETREALHRHLYEAVFVLVDRTHVSPVLAANDHIGLIENLVFLPITDLG